MLPDDFEKVLAVYDDLGDVRAMSIVRWWRSVAIPQFGFLDDKPTLAPLGVVSYEDADDQLARLSGSLKSYLEEDWLDQIQPTALIAAIPIGLPRAQIMKQLLKLIADSTDEQQVVRRELVGRNAPYRLRDAKLHYDTSARYLHCLQLRSAYPDLTLWQIGAMAGISWHSSHLDPMLPNGGDTAENYREQIKYPTSRALNRAHMIAENAARGIFPLYAKCEHAMLVDYPFIYRKRFGPIQRA
ncbi:hypothetical protein BV96_03662 [Sphingomonas paucimobilis]|nr:hypothetical protein BV96_03662 [Sphingomonas paucimobilis]